METYVFFRGKPPGKAALARAIRELGFPFTITDPKGRSNSNGFMPMKLRREETGVELDLFDRSAIAEFAAHGVDQSYERTASFRWGGSSEEAAAGLCGAAALAKLTNGVVFDEAEGRLRRWRKRSSSHASSSKPCRNVPPVSVARDRLISSTT